MIHIIIREIHVDLYRYRYYNNTIVEIYQT